MKRLFIFLFLISATAFGIVKFSGVYFSTTEFYDAKYPFLKEGDIIFQVNPEGQGKAIQLATKSEYTHVGIVMEKDGEWKVFEAVQPVKWTTFNQFISRGTNKHFVIKRIKNRDSVFSSKVISSFKNETKKYYHKNYDIYFDWSDEEMYCTELVWKLYKEVTGIEVGKLQKMREFDLTSEIVKSELDTRYGIDVPLDQKVISPAAMFESENLLEVYRE